MEYDRRRHKKTGWFGHSREHAIAAKGRKVYPNRRKTRVHNRPNVSYPISKIITKDGHVHQLSKPILGVEHGRLVTKQLVLNRPVFTDKEGPYTRKWNLQRYGNYVDIRLQYLTKNGEIISDKIATVFAPTDEALNAFPLSKAKWSDYADVAPASNRTKGQPEFSTGQGGSEIVKVLTGSGGKPINVHGVKKKGEKGFKEATVDRKVFLGALNVENASDFSDEDAGHIIKLAHPGNAKYWADKGYTPKILEEILELKGVQFKHGHMPTPNDLDSNLKAKSWAERKSEMEGKTNLEKRVTQATVTPPQSNVQKPMNSTPITVHERGNQETVVITQQPVVRNSLVTTPVTPKKDFDKKRNMGIITFPRKRTK